MDDKLLVRIYDVGLGDCIYVRVPDRNRCRHILIDCGNKYSNPELLEAAVEDLEAQLPAEPNGEGKRRLDLLVATHAHEDHVRGFDAELFKNIRIERIWMSVAMKPDHGKAAKMRELHDFALTALADLRRSAPSGAVMALADSLYALSKSGALEALSKDLPRANKIEPVYVHAGLGQSATSFFDDSRIRLRVLAPMEDIDHYYLGKTPAALKGLAMVKASAPPDHAAAADGGGAGEPVNISSEDFARLKARLLNNALALALIDGHVVNNTSVVLLLEWRGRRLLFTGDAEVKLAREGGFDEGVSNGSWNVMWAKQKEALSGPLDFLKVGHHGSSNATPWTAQTIAVPRGGGQKPHPVNAVLDAILPVPNDGRTPAAAAAVSTHRTKSWKGIPDPLLMAELGRRVANVKRYDEAVFYAKEGRLDTEPYQVAPTTPQPQRTDLEGGHHIDFRFPAKGRRPPARRTKAVRQ